MNEHNFESEREKLLHNIPVQYDNCFLAGGAITSVFTGTDIRDLDLYFKSEDAFYEAIRVSYEEGCWAIAATKRAITFANKGGLTAQLMHFRYFPTAQDIFDSFDFTCCMAALDIDSKELIMHPRFMVDASKRDLIFNHKTAFPLASAMRVQKYNKKGYSIRKRELLKVVAAVAMKGISSWEDFKDQVGGQYANEIVVSTEGKEFNLDNLVEAIGSSYMINDGQLCIDEGGSTAAAITSEITIPDNAEGLIEAIKEMKSNG